jgi:hypothetical protein
MKAIMCFIFGHYFINIDAVKFIGECGRCGELHNVCYDMAYGDTYSTGKIETGVRE